MNNFRDNLIKGILAGIIVSLSLYLSLISNNQYLNYVLFPVVIFTTIKTHSCLYTISIGKVGFNKKDISFISTVYLGNILGTLILLPFFKESYCAIYTAKISQSIIDMFGKSFFFGMLLYIGVYFSEMNSLYMYLVIASILLSKYEHCIPNVAWMMITHNFSLGALKLIIVSTVGNTLGALAFNYIATSKAFQKKVK